jgi:hypothetical protein
VSLYCQTLATLQPCSCLLLYFSASQAITYSYSYLNPTIVMFDISCFIL